MLSVLALSLSSVVNSMRQHVVVVDWRCNDSMCLTQCDWAVETMCWPHADFH